jgi:hypothetical protein
VAKAVPFAPEHDNEYVASWVNAPVDCEPDNALGPDHAPDAVHSSTLLETQVSVASPPGETPAGAALNVTVGVSPDATLTVTRAMVAPPAPLQLSEKVVVALNAGV